MEKLSIENLVDDLCAEFDGLEEPDHLFFQHIIGFIIKRLGSVSVTCNAVIFYGSYQIKLSGRIIKMHFTNGKFTHLTSNQENVSQTFNKRSYE